jgi:uncharacterized protein with NAD-binding domain and iron-sulfur cluster
MRRESARVVVLGGGVGGLSAAHELAERGFRVTVFERNAIFGGKARSMPVPGTGTDGRRDLPAEHGFRFFPGFYRHLPDTMARIPFSGGRSVASNLVPVRQVQIARVGHPELHFAAHLPRGRRDIPAFIQSIVDTSELGIPGGEMAFFATRLLELLTSCDERRLAEYEKTSWWTFIDAANKSDAYRKYLATGLTRTLVAMRAEDGSARTVGLILLALLFDVMHPERCADRVLTGPTNDVWMDPWVAHLRSLGVTLVDRTRVTGLHVHRGMIAGVDVEADGLQRREPADFVVSALPFEAMAPLVNDDLRRLDPALAAIGRLRSEWMNGILFYLDRDVSVVQGHTLYVDSPWALTSISQRQFWGKKEFLGFGDGRVKGILSVDISDWGTCGIVHGKPARACTREEIREEVWAQIKEHLNDQEVDVLDDAAVLAWFLDPAIEFPKPDAPVNREPLLINTADSWKDRPEARTRVPNLMLASDYVRTYTDLATMESANEAARRATNAILDATGSSAPRCMVEPLPEPRLLAPLRALDAKRWKRGLPHLLARTASVPSGPRRTEPTLMTQTAYRAPDTVANDIDAA